MTAVYLTGIEKIADLFCKFRLDEDLLQKGKNLCSATDHEINCKNL